MEGQMGKERIKEGREEGGRGGRQGGRTEHIVICNNTDGTKDHYGKSNRPGTERQIAYNLTHIQAIKKLISWKLNIPGYFSEAWKIRGYEGVTQSVSTKVQFRVSSGVLLLSHSTANKDNKMYSTFNNVEERILNIFDIWVLSRNVQPILNSIQYIHVSKHLVPLRYAHILHLYVPAKNK